MRHYPRAWNRFFCFVVGLLLLAGGVGVALAQLWPRVHDLWLTHGPRWYEQLVFQVENTQRSIGSWSFSLITMLATLVLLSLAFLLMVTIFCQSGGKTKHAMKLEASQISSGNGVGSITFTTQFIDEFVQRELADDPNIISIATSNWRVKRKTALLLKVKVARGASPAVIYTEIARATSKLDRLLGYATPLMIHLVQGNAITASFNSNAPRVI